MQNKKTILPAVLAVLITIGVVWFTNRAVTPGDVEWEYVLSEAKDGGYRLINTAELFDRYEKSSDNILLVDTRQEWEYRTGHIKGAVNFPMEPTWWSRWRKASQLEKFLGPDKEHLVAFSAGGGRSTLRPSRRAGPQGALPVRREGPL